MIGPLPVRVPTDEFENDNQDARRGCEDCDRGFLRLGHNDVAVILGLRDRGCRPLTGVEVCNVFAEDVEVYIPDESITEDRIMDPGVDEKELGEIIR